MVREEKILYTYKELVLFHLLIITPFVLFAFFCFISIYFWIGLLIVGAIYVAYRKMFHKVIFYEDQIKAKSFFLSQIYYYKDTIDAQILRENNLEPPIVQIRFKNNGRLNLTPKSRLDALALLKVLRSKDIKFIKTEEYIRFINWEKTKEMSDNDWA